MLNINLGSRPVADRFLALFGLTLRIKLELHFKIKIDELELPGKKYAGTL